MAAKADKKRPRAAATHASEGPKSKKPHLGGKNEQKTKKRGRPVTLPVPVGSSGSEDEDGNIGESGIEEDQWTDEEGDPGDGDHLDGEDAAMGQENADETLADGAETAISLRPKDPNAARESHKAQKILQEQRRAAKPHSDLLTDSKRVWALARQKNIPPAERQKHIHALMDVLRGRVKDVVLKHDASRIVQTAVKWGRQKERDEIAVELKGKYKELAQNKYSKFLVTKLIRLCPTHRASILLEFQSHVLRMLLHREASSVLADAFELYANAYERTILLRDFYGKETALFSVTSGSSEDKERAKRGLKGVLDGVDSERRRRVLASLKENLVTIFNNSDKGAVTHAIVHRALWEYMSVIDTIPEEPERDKLRREMFESCQEVLAEMVHTKDGSRVVREFLAQGTAKDRKQILKALKPHIERMCLDDEAQLVLFTALDVIDDTKLVAKSLISEITACASKLYLIPQGRRALFYLIVPRTRRHFTPAQIVSLAETDAARARTSKKAPELRAAEVCTFASEALVTWVEKTGGEVLREPGGSLVIAEIMLFADGAKDGAIQTLLQAIAISYPSADTSAPHPIDLPHVSRLYKNLLQGGHFDRSAQTVERATGWEAGSFANSFAQQVGRDNVLGMCTMGARGGVFVVAELCAALCLISGGVENENRRKEVKMWFTPDVVALIENSDVKGKAVLLEGIARL
ncbi:puf family RNA-binding protein [Infundibulicybe gibba]|nr:puf family RNA-binding protein [Infundibulicybe gibba]